MKIFGATQKNSPHKMFLHKCVLQYVRTLKLNDATLALLGKLKYSRWRPRWPLKDKILNIFLSMWARQILFVATHRFLKSRNRISMLEFISDISVTCLQNGGQDGRQSIKSPNIFFNIRARIIIFVSSYRFWESRNSIGMLKMTSKHTNYTKWRTRLRTKQRQRH